MTPLSSACLPLLWAALLLALNCACLEDPGATEHAAELTTSLLEFIVKTGGRENRILQTVCPALSDVHINRTALNQGFHRDVVTEVTLPVSMATPPMSCRLLLVETVPAGMYVDLHQVTFRTDFGGPQVLALRDIDVEQAAHQSFHHRLLLYSPLQQNPKGFTWRVTLPVHLRYHRWAGEGEDTSATVRLEGPDVLMHCEGDRPVTTPCEESRLFPAPCDAESRGVCLWQLLKGKAEPLLFQVPIGPQPAAMALRPLTRLLQASASVARLHRPSLVSLHLLSARQAAPFSTSRVLRFSFNVQDEEDFKDRVLNNTKPVIVDFHATWCGPCKVLAPRLDKVISAKNGDVELAKVDIDNLQEIAMQYDVRAVPTVVGLKDGKVVDTFMGVVDEDILEVFVEKLST